MRRSGPVARLVAVVAVVGIGAAALSSVSPRAGAQPRRVVVLGDSIILGAEATMVQAFRVSGFEVTFDAAVSRSTAAALDVLEAHRPQLTDNLVLSFGANDAGNPTTFRQRVERLLDAAGPVPHIYWLTIREVRDYYAAANQILREVAAARPNVTVVDWHGATVGDASVTAGDGLHLTGSGAGRMTLLVLDAVLNGGAQPAPPPPREPTAPPETAPPGTAPPETAPPGTGAPEQPEPTPTAAPGPTSASPPPTSGSTTTTEPDQGAGAADEEREELAGRLDPAITIGASWGGGVLAIAAILLVAGVALALWSLRVAGPARTRAPSARHPAVRSRLRAERIAAARERHHPSTPRPDQS